MQGFESRRVLELPTPNWPFCVALSQSVDSLTKALNIAALSEIFFS